MGLGTHHLFPKLLSFLKKHEYLYVGVRRFNPTSHACFCQKQPQLPNFTLTCVQTASCPTSKCFLGNPGDGIRQLGEQINVK